MAAVSRRCKVCGLAAYGSADVAPGRDVVIYRGSRVVAYDEEYAPECVTTHYECAGCDRRFDTIDELLQYCAGKEGGMRINGVPIPDSTWQVVLSACEKQDIVSANLFDMMGKDEIVAVIRGITRVFDTEEAAAPYLGIGPGDVQDATHCLVLGSTGRIVIV